MKNLKLPSPLVTVSWLLEYQNHSSIVVLDATIPKVGNKIPEKYRAVSIEGARLFDIKNDFSDINSPLPNTLPTPEQFTANAQKLGIRKDSIIVIYDQWGIYSSPRAWWLLKTMGHDQVAVLNGGLPTWEAMGGKTTEAPYQHITYQHGNFEAQFSPQWLATVNEVVIASANQTANILDARNAERFAGKVPEPRAGLRSGHIPHSANLPYQQVLQNGQFLKSSEELQSIFAKDSEPDKPFICSCGSGITASILAFAAHIANISSVAVYDGSWSEWGMPSERPVAIS